MIQKCKEGLTPKGVDLLKNAKDLTKIKIVALGGILSQNIKQIIDYCDDYAVMSTLFKSDNIQNTIEDYNKNGDNINLKPKEKNKFFGFLFFA